jgi:hypothetical protein
MLIQDPEYRITHHFSEGLYAKESFFTAGMAILKHTHNFSHLSILAHGKVAVLHGTEIDIVSAPACIEIEAGGDSWSQSDNRLCLVLYSCH